MKIAFSGASSTGKTTLVNALLADGRFAAYASKLVKVDARKIIESYGCKNVDEMSRQQLEDFEFRYFKEKKRLEAAESDFVTERSFVDIAAYWVVRDTFDKPFEYQDLLIVPCKAESRKYDLTVYLPFGLIPFEADGYRSENLFFHKAIDNKIHYFLDSWKINYITLDVIDLSLRVESIISYITTHGHTSEK